MWFSLYEPLFSLFHLEHNLGCYLNAQISAFYSLSQPNFVVVFVVVTTSISVWVPPEIEPDKSYWVQIAHLLVIPETWARN